jgi:hypothetical protein
MADNRKEIKSLEAKETVTQNQRAAPSPELHSSPLSVPKLSKQNGPGMAVVTYPEFAPRQEPPMSHRFSLARLLILLYISAGATAVTYVISKVSNLGSIPLNL